MNDIGTRDSVIWAARTIRDTATAGSSGSYTSPGSYFLYLGRRENAADDENVRYWFYDSENDTNKQYGFSLEHSPAGTFETYQTFSVKVSRILPGKDVSWELLFDYDHYSLPRDVWVTSISLSRHSRLNLRWLR